RRERVMAGQTVVATGEPWRIDLNTIEHVKDQPLLRILRGQLDEPATHPGHGDRLVEEDGPRVAETDAATLQAIGNEHGDLRLDRYVERFQSGAKVARGALEHQPGTVALEIAVQSGHPIVRRCRRVGNQDDR